MCSIFGALGYPDPELLLRLRKSAGDRGRDGGRVEHYETRSGYFAALGNWRATPTPEVEKAPFQPYQGIVHNGTIANDKELGVQEGEVDSMVLPRILIKDKGIGGFARSVSRIVGSYAIGCFTGEDIYLACNYKPLYYWSPDEDTTYFSSMARHFAGLTPRGQAPVAVPPYSVMSLLTGGSADILRTYQKKAIVVASAGLDSTVVAAMLVQQGYKVRLLHFRYACLAEKREVAMIPLIADALGVEFDFMDVDYSKLKGKSPLLGEAEYGDMMDAATFGPSISDSVTGAEYAHEWVPARNLVMLSLATAYAEANGFHTVALGNNLEEAGAYPDNEEEFTGKFNSLLPFAVQNGYKVEVISPVGNLMKHEVVREGVALDAPFHLTWSCYRDGEHHCGRCGPCFMRKTAFERNGLKDPVMEFS